MMVEVRYTELYVQGLEVTVMLTRLKTVVIGKLEKLMERGDKGRVEMSKQMTVKFKIEMRHPS